MFRPNKNSFQFPSKNRATATVPQSAKWRYDIQHDDTQPNATDQYSESRVLCCYAKFRYNKRRGTRRMTSRVSIYNTSLSSILRTGSKARLH
jgi:hypothetical protein